jgi:beta-lactam-binding protein with PASTA domain
VSGATIHLTGAGSCTVTASQPGDANYTAVASVARTFTAQAPQTPPRATCSVPYVVGKTLASARKKIAAAHCRVGTVRRATSKRVRAGRVVLQRPAAGTRLPAGTKIKLVLSRG